MINWFKSKEILSNYPLLFILFFRGTQKFFKNKY